MAMGGRLTARRIGHDDGHHAFPVDVRDHVLEDGLDHFAMRRAPGRASHGHARQRQPNAAHSDNLSHWNNLIFCSVTIRNTTAVPSPSPPASGDGSVRPT